MGLESKVAEDNQFQSSSTIVAIVTPIGGPLGTVGIMQLSGDKAVEVAGRVFRSAKSRRRRNRESELWQPRSHVVEYGVVVDSKGNVVDEVLFPLSASVDLNSLREDVLKLLCTDDVDSSTVASSEYNLRATVLKAPHGDFLTCMEMAKVPDLIAFVASANDDISSLIDSFGSKCLYVLRSIGLPSSAVLIRDLPSELKMKNALRMMCASKLASEFPEDCFGLEMLTGSFCAACRNLLTMGDARDNEAYEEELLDYEEEDEKVLNSGTKVNGDAVKNEKMLAALIASGASPGAVTDPNVQDPLGKTPASIAASNGHKGLAGYLSEVALTNHLSLLTLEETEDSKDKAQAEAEIRVKSIAGRSHHPVNDDPQSLAALKNILKNVVKILSY